MNEIRYTLLSEGTSDKALIPILDWLLVQHLPGYAVQSEWADLARLPKPPKTLPERIKKSIELYPCDLIFVHRDADSQGVEKRAAEISSALKVIEDFPTQTSLIGVIPIRMTEAWLFISEDAIRMAAENPRGSQTLQLPTLGTVEQHPDPKSLLNDLLRQASGASGRRLKKLNSRLTSKVQRIPEIVQDFSSLRNLQAFRFLESDVVSFIESKLLQG
ncbi:MAG: hypothetical protein WBG32_22695 [Nodosilinea sp.]